MGVSPTGNGRRESFAHAPMPRMTNTYMLSGDRDPEEILGSVRNGLYVVNFGGGQVDIIAGEIRVLGLGSLSDRRRQDWRAGKRGDHHRQRSGCAIHKKMIGNDISSIPGSARARTARAYSSGSASRR